MMRFLRCIGEAVAGKGLRALAGVIPLGECLFDIAADAIERYGRSRQEARIRQDAEQVFQATMEQVRQEAQQIAREVLPQGLAEEVARLEHFLTQVPAVARQSLKRPGDRTGKTIPPHLDLLDPIQLVGLLPRRLPLFQTGEPLPHAPQWRFVNLLGAGGFGEVWLARHTFLDQVRAVKFCLDPKARKRLLEHEGEVVKRVMAASTQVRADEHGIVPLVDAYLDGETPWLAYEYVDGGDLAMVIREHATLPAETRSQRALSILADLADLIGRYHTLPLPIIHCDLKPANILLAIAGNGWRLRVTDFGIGQAAIPTPSLNLGETFRGAHSPIYSSPQQKRGLKPDARDDVYALGIIGWQLMLGNLEEERPTGRWRKRLAACRLSEAILDLLESCWDDDASERPANAAELGARIRKSLEPVQEVATAKDASPPRSEVSFADLHEAYESYRQYVSRENDPKQWLLQQKEKIHEWRKGAEQGHATAMVLLGECYVEGISVTQDHAEAMRWYRLAAENQARFSIFEYTETFFNPKRW